MTLAEGCRGVQPCTRGVQRGPEWLSSGLEQIPREELFLGESSAKTTGLAIAPLLTRRVYGT
jgi:hypothetical protein